MTQPIGPKDPFRNQCSLDDVPSTCESPRPPPARPCPKPSGPFIGGYTSSDGSTGVSREAVNQLVSSATMGSRLPAQTPATDASAPARTGSPRSAAECGDRAVKTAVVCAGGLTGAIASAPSIAGGFVFGAAAGFACADAYAEYTDCLKGKK